MNGFLPRHLHPFGQLLLLVALMVAGACVGLFAVYAFATLGLGLPAIDVTTALARPADFPQGWSLAMGSQGRCCCARLVGRGAGAAVGVGLALGVRISARARWRPAGHRWERRPSSS